MQIKTRITQPMCAVLKIRRKPLVLFLLTFVLFNANLVAQLDNSGLFFEHQKTHLVESGAVNFNFYSLGYNKNNEYFEPTANGYTLFGYLLRPELNYKVQEGLSVSAGIIARKDFGNLDYKTIQPTFLISLLHDSLTFNFGTLRGPLEHQFIEPLYDFERIVTNNPENGMQFLWSRPTISADAFISWNRMIYDRSPFRETFDGGASIIWDPIKKGNFKLGIPLQFLATHVGGQIDDDPNPARSALNFVAGVQLSQRFDKGSFLEELALKSYYTYFTSYESAPYLIPPYRDGSGLYLNLCIATKHQDIMISYWNGQEYSSFNGGHLYQSTSKNWREPLALQPNRQIIIFRLLNDIEFGDHLHILPRMEPYWNINDNVWGISFGLYLKFQNHYYLGKIKSN